MEQDIPQSPLAIYIHIPFCLSKCGYCSFYSEPFGQKAVADYIRVLHEEIDLYQSLYPDLPKADTIYFGGGSPSLLSGEQIRGICESFEMVERCEISLEINPIQITPSYLENLQKSPVNRLSIGLQSMHDEELIWLERRHKSSQIPSKIRLLREAGYTNYSLDLIYGLPGRSLRQLEENIGSFLELDPMHISSYLLSLDEDCRWKAEKDAKWEAVEAHDEARQAASYELICQKLEQAGFEQYEISNFCRQGARSRHNMHYWLGNDYLGLGASASGFFRGIRYNNSAETGQYAHDVCHHKAFPIKDPNDSPADDWLMMALRLRQGISRHEALAKLGYDLWSEKAERLERLVQLKLIKMETEHIALTQKACFISNAVILELIR